MEYMSVDNNFKHKVQLVSYLTTKYRNDDKELSILQAIKILFLADVYTVRNYGVSLTDDTYYAMKNGPVLSTIDNIIEQNNEWLLPEQLKYTKQFLTRNSERNNTRDTIEVDEKTDSDYLSELDKEAIDTVYEQFKDKSADELIDLTHTFHAWSKHKDTINQNKREKMDLEDLLRDNDGALCVENKILERSRRVYGKI